MRALVAALTDGHVALHRFCAPRNVVRVVTGEARHVAALEAGRLPQAVRGSRDFELVLRPAPAAWSK